jgi:hypothetical protein
VAGAHLGLARLTAERWQAVLDAGVRRGLFTVDTDTLSYPTLEPGPAHPKRPERPEHIPPRGTYDTPAHGRVMLMSHGWDYAVVWPLIGGNNPAKRLQIPWTEWDDVTVEWTSLDRPGGR